MDKNVVLIGFMGCGKSSVGKRLSEKTGYPLLDTDQLIEEEQKTTISEIFASKGEEAFRQMETKMLQKLGKTEPGFVISTGGGLPTRDENISWLKALGTVVYLKVSPEVVYERLKGDTKRPLLQGDNPMEKICTLMSAREQKYQNCADVILDVSQKSFDEIVDAIIKETT